MAVCAAVAEVLCGSHNTLDAIFEAAGAPGPPVVPVAAVLSFLVESAFFDVSAVKRDWSPGFAVSFVAVGVRVRVSDVG